MALCRVITAVVCCPNALLLSVLHQPNLWDYLPNLDDLGSGAVWAIVVDEQDLSHRSLLSQRGHYSGSGGGNIPPFVVDRDDYGVFSIAQRRPICV